MSYNQYTKQASPTDRSPSRQLTYTSMNGFYNITSQQNNNLTNKRQPEFQNRGSFGPDFSMSSRSDFNMQGSKSSSSDTFQFQDDPKLKNFNQLKYDADSYDAFAMPTNDAEMNHSQGLPDHMIHHKTEFHDASVTKVPSYPQFDKYVFHSTEGPDHQNAMNPINQN